MAFLYQYIDQLAQTSVFKKINLPAIIRDNLKSEFELRPYQIEAFKRFIFFEQNSFDGKPLPPYHLLFNMATGSGKTLIMAGIMLYLFEKGYRNFIFFVHSNNIIQKTKNNFLNDQANKYLFNKHIYWQGKPLLIKEVVNFDESDSNNLNIKFTTIQQLHLDLNDFKENSLTFEDFKDKKIVLIADEAHHLSTATKSKKELEANNTWESTVLKILHLNPENFLLEFTATVDWKHPDIRTKYANKIIFRYDLKQFRLDGYSKEINLIRSHYDEQERILQALILNIYRQELAAENGINLKPVILFKAKRTIAESENNKRKFHQLIQQLSEQDILKIQQTSTIEVVQKAFAYFNKKDLSHRQLANKIKWAFKEENCLSANNDAEAEQNQILLNTLEDANNPIRAVFAVQKLNEGWDVLNLFDIVRLYEGRDGRGGKAGKTTIAEAQLIGRGARYFPFTTSEYPEKYRRKFDQHPQNPLKILEELYYHTKEDSRYISELKSALIESGIYEEKTPLPQKPLTLKASFKTSTLYSAGRLFYNKKIKDVHQNIESLAVIKTKPFHYVLPSGRGEISRAFESELSTTNGLKQKEIRHKIVTVHELPHNVIRFALSQNPFYHFNHLKQYFPQLKSLSEFIFGAQYLSSIKIDFTGSAQRLQKIGRYDYLQAVQKLLQEIEFVLKNQSTSYTASNFTSDLLRNIITDRLVSLSPKFDSAPPFFVQADWYPYQQFYGSKYEQEFLKWFATEYARLKTHFQELFLTPNLNRVTLYDLKGKAWVANFILFARPPYDSKPMQQIYIFLQEQTAKTEHQLKPLLDLFGGQSKTLTIDGQRYHLSACLFFKDDSGISSKLKKALGLKL